MKLSGKLGIIALIAISMRMYGMDVVLEEQIAAPILHKSNIVRPDRLSARNGNNFPIEFQASTVSEHGGLTLVPNQITRLLPIPVISSAKKTKAGKTIDTYGPRLALIEIAPSDLIPQAIRKEITRELDLDQNISFDQALRNKQVNFNAYIAITGYIPNGKNSSLYSLQLHPWNLDVEKTPGKKGVKVGIFKPYAGIRGLGKGTQNAPFNSLTSARAATIEEDVVMIPGEFGQEPQPKSIYTFTDQNMRFGLDKKKKPAITTFWSAAVTKRKNSAIVMFYVFANTKAVTDKLFSAVKTANTVQQLTNNMKVLARTLKQSTRTILEEAAKAITELTRPRVTIPFRAPIPAEELQATSTSTGQSELYTALVARNKASVVHLLAQHKTLKPEEIQKANANGETPLVMAIRLGVEKLANDLIDAGAQFEEEMVNLSARDTALRRMLENKWAERQCPICMAVPEAGHELHEFPPRGYTGCKCNIKTKVCDTCARRMIQPKRDETYGVMRPKCPYCRGRVESVADWSNQLDEYLPRIQAFENWVRQNPASNILNSNFKLEFGSIRTSIEKLVTSSPAFKPGLPKFFKGTTDFLYIHEFQLHLSVQKFLQKNHLPKNYFPSKTLLNLEIPALSFYYSFP